MSPGGFLNAFKFEISAGLRVSSAEIAAFSAGMAMANSPSHSSLIVFAAVAASFATASSA